MMKEKGKGKADDNKKSIVNRRERRRRIKRRVKKRKERRKEK